MCNKDRQNNNSNNEAIAGRGGRPGFGFVIMAWGGGQRNGSQCRASQGTLLVLEMLSYWFEQLLRI